MYQCIASITIYFESDFERPTLQGALLRKHIAQGDALGYVLAQPYGVHCTQ